MFLVVLSSVSILIVMAAFDHFVLRAYPIPGILDSGAAVPNAYCIRYPASCPSDMWLEGQSAVHFFLHADMGQVALFVLGLLFFSLLVLLAISLLGSLVRKLTGHDPIPLEYDNMGPRTGKREIDRENKIDSMLVPFLISTAVIGAIVYAMQ